MMTTWSNTIELVKARAATLASRNNAAVKKALEAWCVKTAKESTASHKTLKELLKRYRLITALSFTAKGTPLLLSLLLRRSRLSDVPHKTNCQTMAHASIHATRGSAATAHVTAAV